MQGHGACTTKTAAHKHNNPESNNV